MKIINIVDSVAKVNFGIWNSAVSTAHILKQAYNVDSELWYPKTAESLPDACAFNGCILREIGTFDPKGVLNDQCILVSHGCWQLPTRYAHSIHRQYGTPWMYVPHGMLEPNSMKQKFVLKKIFYYLKERPLSSQADLVRAVSMPEQTRLQNDYSQVVHIANGVEPHTSQKIVSKKRRQYLFMARLHQQKGIGELLQAWQNSTLAAMSECTLIVVGPDDGELPLVQSMIADAKNIQYLGAKYGAEKFDILTESQFYILPSKAEGFPTSVVEAMQFGLVPIITDNCNFPECFAAKLGIHTDIDIHSIINSLEQSLLLTDDEISEMSLRASLFIQHNYLLTHIADKQYHTFKSLLNK